METKLCVGRFWPADNRRTTGRQVPAARTPALIDDLARSLTCIAQVAQNVVDCHHTHKAFKFGKRDAHPNFLPADLKGKILFCFVNRWLWPDVFKNQDTSVAKAKKAIADYKKAIGQPEGLAELAVFFCARAVGFGSDVGLQDEGYFDALVRMFAQPLKAIKAVYRREGCALSAPVPWTHRRLPRPLAKQDHRQVGLRAGLRE
jgi:hypothetical protein